MLSPFYRAITITAALIAITGCNIGANRAAAFDGTRAYGILKNQCDLGPRYTGTTGYSAAGDLIESELKKTADEVETQHFKKFISGKELEFKNIYGVFNPNADKFVLLCAHWDTRPMADQEIDPVKAKKPIIGANDGASGVAILLELAREFHEKKPDVGVVMAFFDGEDYGPGPREMFLGSVAFAKNWKTVVKPAGREISYDYGILLDMVGDGDLQICKERTSTKAASKIVDKVWNTAKEMGKGDVFLDEERYMISDDHIPLLQAGIKCIDLIDFDYASWHTLDDTADKCSAKSLQTVGDVIAKVIYSEKPASK